MICMKKHFHRCNGFLPDNAWRDCKQNLYFNSGYYFKKRVSLFLQKLNLCLGNYNTKPERIEISILKDAMAEHETSICCAFYILQTEFVTLSIALNSAILSRTYGHPHRPNREEYKKRD